MAYLALAHWPNASVSGALERVPSSFIFWNAGLSLSDVADRLGKEHRLKAVGRIDPGKLQYQILTDTQASGPVDLENYTIEHKNGQWIRAAGFRRYDVLRVAFMTSKYPSSLIRVRRSDGNHVRCSGR